MYLNELIDFLVQLRTQLPAEIDNPKVCILSNGELHPDIGIGVIKIDDVDESLLMLHCQSDIQEAWETSVPHLRLIKDSD